MPCYRCGARQTDPVRGASPWKRGVHLGGQVLVCPDCQQGRDWTADLDRCPQCGSTMLVRALGQTTCRGCAAVVEVPSAPPSDDAAGGPAALSDEVARALERVLRAPPA